MGGSHVFVCIWAGRSVVLTLAGYNRNARGSGEGQATFLDRQLAVTACKSPPLISVRLAGPVRVALLLDPVIEKDAGLLDRVVAKQMAGIESEVAGLSAEAERLKRAIEELTGSDTAEWFQRL